MHDQTWHGHKIDSTAPNFRTKTTKKTFPFQNLLSSPAFHCIGRFHRRMSYLKKGGQYTKSFKMVDDLLQLTKWARNPYGALVFQICYTIYIQIERYDIYIRDKKEKKQQYNSEKIDHFYDMWDHTDILTLMDATGFIYHYPIVRKAVNMPFLIYIFCTVGKKQLGSFWVDA